MSDEEVSFLFLLVFLNAFLWKGWVGEPGLASLGFFNAVKSVFSVCH